MSITQQPEALNLEEFRAKVTHAARGPLLARILELEAQLAAATPVAPQGWKLVQIELLERIQESLGSFLSDQGWSQSDMDTADALGGLLAAAPQPQEAAQKIEDFVVQVEATNAEVEKLKAEVGKLQQQLIVEAKKAAEEKLRADQLDKQHTMQSRMHVEANQNLAALQASAPPALPEPVAWLATFSPKGMLSSRSIAGVNLEELKRSVPSDSVFKPLYAHPAEGVPVQVVQPSDALIEAVDAWFADNTGLGGCSDKDVAELAAIFATHPTQQGLDARDAAIEAVRKAFCKLQRYSFWLNSKGNVRRCADSSGNWVEFEAAHTLFEPQSVDDALAAQAKHGEAQQ